MVTIAQTTKKYHGRKAETYDEIRTKQERWDLEHEYVEQYLMETKPRSVFDCPVGTGRFIPIYKKLGIQVTGMDVSDSMIALAKKKLRGATNVKLEVGDALATGQKNKSFDTAVCVRFLDLIDEDAMRAVTTELARITKRHIIVAMRFGDKYINKSNTATHDRKKFHAHMGRLGFVMVKSMPIFNEGWEVMLLGPKK